MIKAISNYIRILNPIAKNDIDFVLKQYKESFSKDLDLIKPNTFNEKLQWLKLFERNPLYTKLADKYLVRKYVADKVGKEILNELYGVYEKFEDINFQKLPQSFVIKATHGSGWNIICKNKRDIDLILVKKEINSWLSDNYYNYGKEYVYKNIKPRIIIEKYLGYKNGSSLNDYKFFCFHGEPRFIQVDIDRFTNHTRNFYDLQWDLLPFELLYESNNNPVPKPKNLSLMIEICNKLSKGINFCRVDLYDLDDKVIFGEITFYPENGLGHFKPYEYDEKIGKFLKL